MCKRLQEDGIIVRKLLFRVLKSTITQVIPTLRFILKSLAFADILVKHSKYEEAGDFLWKIILQMNR